MAGMSFSNCTQPHLPHMTQVSFHAESTLLHVYNTCSTVSPGSRTHLQPVPSTTPFHPRAVQVTLDKYKGKYVVLFFYPLDFTFVCPTEITAFSDRYEEFQKLGTEVLGVSVDSQFTHLAWIQTPRKVRAPRSAGTAENGETNSDMDTNPQNERTTGNWVFH